MFIAGINLSLYKDEDVDKPLPKNRHVRVFRHWPMDRDTSKSAFFNIAHLQAPYYAEHATTRLVEALFAPLQEKAIAEGRVQALNQALKDNHISWQIRTKKDKSADKHRKCMRYLRNHRQDRNIGEGHWMHADAFRRVQTLEAKQ